MTYRLRTLAAVQLLLGAAFGVLSWLVVSGRCTRLDQYAIDHWMARIGTGSAHSSVLSALRPYPEGGSASEIAFNVWTLPASVVVSGAVLALCCVALERRGQRRGAIAWIVAWVAVNVIEVAGKGLLHRPALSGAVHGVRERVAGFDTSFPSGHTARGLVIAFMLAALWPRLAWPAGIWAVGTCILLVVSGDHTPSDVVGGVLAALFVLTWVDGGGGTRLERWNSTLGLERFAARTGGRDQP
jgi:membrane-associated phospholipid phosphatase